MSRRRLDLNPTAMAAGGEFDRIRAILGDPAELAGPEGDPALSVGPGDDAAVLGQIVVSTDLTVEDVHFRREWIGLEALGHRAVTVALSDVGAMGARPVAVLWSLMLPDPGIDAARALGAGVRRAASAAGAVLAGGDLSRSPGPLAMDVVAIGRTEDPVLRSTAQPGDDLWVTGALGGAAGAVALWQAGEAPGELLKEPFERPRPPLTLLGELRKEGRVTAGIDISDGLLADAGHLAAASRVGIRIQEGAVPVHPGLSTLGPERRLRLALTGGEDYQLLFTAPPGVRSALRGRAAGPVLTRIGEVVEGAGVVRVAPDGHERAVGVAGYDHFPEGGS